MKMDLGYRSSSRFRPRTLHQVSHVRRQSGLRRRGRRGMRGDCKGDQTARRRGDELPGGRNRQTADQGHARDHRERAGPSGHIGK